MDEQEDLAVYQGKRAAMLRRLRVVDAWLVLSAVQSQAAAGGDERTARSFDDPISVAPAEAQNGGV